MEVVNAQAALENARLAEVASLAEFNLARLNLLRRWAMRVISGSSRL